MKAHVGSAVPHPTPKLASTGKFAQAGRGRGESGERGILVHRTMGGLGLEEGGGSSVWCITTLLGQAALDGASQICTSDITGIDLKSHMGWLGLYPG